MNVSTAKGLTTIILFSGAMLAAAYWYVDRSERRAGAPPAPPEHALECYKAIEANDLVALGKVLDEHAELLTFNFGSEGSALHLAARFDRVEMVRLLLDRGAAIDARGQWNGTALHWACWWGSKAAAEELLERGAAIEDRKDVFGSTPLLWVAHGSANCRNPAGSYAELAEALIDQGAAADTENADGVPAIVMASPEVAKVLKDHGAKPPATRPADPAARPEAI